MEPLPPLSREEIAHFKREGYLVKRNVLDPELCRRARDALWEKNASAVLRRDDSATHIGPFPEHDERNDATGMHIRKGYLWNVREAGGDALLHDLLPHRVMPWLEQLLGKDQVVQPIADSARGQNIWGGYELRGYYTVLRQPPDAPRIALREQYNLDDLRTAHVDFQPIHLTCTGYIDEVGTADGATGGGTVLYPRTHRLLYETNPMFARLAQAQELKATRGDGVIRTELRPELKEDFSRISQGVTNMDFDDLQPFEFTGSAGDVCLWHTRLFHRSCHNYSDRLRHALFYDVAKKSVNRHAYRELRSFQPQHYQPARMEQSLRAMEAEAGGAEEEEYYGSEEPTGLWADWSEEVRSCPEELGEPALAEAAAQRAGKL